MFDVTYASIKQNLDGLRAQLTKIDDRIASNPTNRAFLDLQKQVQDAIETDEERLQVILNASDASQRRTNAKIGAIYDSTNAIHDNTNQLSQKTDSLHGIANEHYDVTIAMHSKIDILHEKADSGVVNDKVSFLGVQVAEVANMLGDVSDAVVGGLGPKIDSLASQMASIDKKLSMDHMSSGGMALLQEAVGMQHLIVADTNGPIHGFAKLQDQVTGIQSMLAQKSESLHDSIYFHISDQAATACGQLNCIEDQLTALRDQGDCVERFEDRMVLLEQKIDSLAGLEKKLDSLIGLGEKLDGLAGLEEKLDGLSILHEKFFNIEDRLNERLSENVKSSGNWGLQAGLSRSKPASIASQDQVNTWGAQCCGVGSSYAQQDEDETWCRAFDDQCGADGWAVPPVNNTSGTAYGDTAETAEASNIGWDDDQHQEDNFWHAQGPTTPPPVHILEHHAIQSDGTIRDNHGKTIGQVVQGNAKEFADMQYYCDDLGNVLDQEGCAVGSVETVIPTEKVEDAADAEGASLLPLSVLDRLLLEADGTVLNPITGSILGYAVEDHSGFENLSMYRCDAEGHASNYADKTTLKVRTVAQDFGTYEGHFATTKREDLNKYWIDTIMSSTGYNRELVTMMLMKPESAAAKKLMAIMNDW